MDEKRQFQRFNFDSRARLNATDASWDTRILDISLRGALLARPPGWDYEPGTAQAIQVDLESGDKIEMDVTVSHVDQNRIGCRCDRIDLDSFAHLKQVVLANIGSEDALNRELAALG